MSEPKHYQPTAKIEEVMLGICVGIAFVLTQLPYEKTDEASVPTVIFKDRPYFFQSFIIALNFAFFGSFVTIKLRQLHPRIARCSLLLAIVSLALVIGIPLWLLFPTTFLTRSTVLRDHHHSYR